jgi:hypothetical protein
MNLRVHISSSDFSLYRSRCPAVKGRENEMKTDSPGGAQDRLRHCWRVVEEVPGGELLFRNDS